MPTGTTVSYAEMRTLRSLATCAVIDHILEPDKTRLSKAFQLGILPVKVVDDIYCHWIQRAIARREAVLTKPRHDRRDAFKESQAALLDLSQAERLYSDRPNNTTVKDLEKISTMLHANAHRLYDSLLALEATEKEKLNAIKDVLSAKECEALTDRVPFSGAQKAHEALLDITCPKFEFDLYSRK